MKHENMQLPRTKRYLPIPSPVAWAWFILPLILGLGIDLGTKYWAFQTLVVDVFTDTSGRMQMASSEHAFIKSVLHFRAHVNYGAVFGVGQGNRILFLLVSFVAIALLIYLFLRSGNQRFYQLLVGMLLAGVLGNMYDRMVYGYVRDMLYAFPGITWGDWFGFLPDTWKSYEVFPWIFNIADSLLCVGVFGMFIYSFVFGDEPSEATKNNPKST